jgi:hypothetical protein
LYAIGFAGLQILDKTTIIMQVDVVDGLSFIQLATLLACHFDCFCSDHRHHPISLETVWNAS